MEIFNVLAGVGITILIVYAKPLAAIRGLISKTKFGAGLIKCALCVGFWVGLGLALWQDDWRYATVVPLAAWFYDSLIGRLIGEY
mgnify:CR=1 FL=1